MKRAPKIGARVVAWFDRGDPDAAPGFSNPRSCVGVVTAIHQRYADEFDDEGDLIRRGPLAPEAEWRATVRYEGERPAWWPYPGDSFVPAVADLDPAP